MAQNMNRIELRLGEVTVEFPRESPESPTVSSTGCRIEANALESLGVLTRVLALRTYGQPSSDQNELLDNMVRHQLHVLSARIGLGETVSRVVGHYNRERTIRRNLT